MIYRIKSVYKATDEPTISYCDIGAKDEYEAAYLFYQNHGFKYEVLSVAEVVNGKGKKVDITPKTLYLGAVEDKKEARNNMIEQWQELKETITELRDNDGTGTQQEVCKFLANLMNILEKQMEEPETVTEFADRCRECGAKYGKALEQTRWIPVSERLPKAGEYIGDGDVAKYYLVQNEYGDMMVARYTHSEYWEQIYKLKPIGDEIVAWRELPEPYVPDINVGNKEESEDKI